MKWLATIAQSVLDRISGFRRRARGRKREKPHRIRYERVEDFPQQFHPDTLYVAGEDPYLWAAAMLCPCGCGDTIQLSLLEDESPCWRLCHEGDGAVSLRPSVWRTKGCRSHFFVRRSRIEWCRFETGDSSGRIGRR
jgi:hypothetical protein